MLTNDKDFTQGKILRPFLFFSMPIMFALFLQFMYGAIDLLVIGKFSEAPDVSAIATGAQIMTMLTTVTSSLAMGMTIFLGEKIGEKKENEVGIIVANGMFLFVIYGVILSFVMILGAEWVASIMNVPNEAFVATVQYIRICGAGCIVIVLYNLIGAIFRGVGDSKTPLITVAIATCCNVAGDFIFVAGLHMGTVGAAIATVLSQLISVFISWIIIRKQNLLFQNIRKDFQPDGKTLKKILLLGTPIALQDLLVNLSFLIILGIVNVLGVYASAGVGIGERVVNFLILVPIAFMQSMSAFVAQNRGARRFDRARRVLCYAVAVSTVFGVAMFVLAFFFGNYLSWFFVDDQQIIIKGAEYLKAYGIDCLINGLMFCLIGYLNGMEKTRIVMLQGIIGAFLVRVPISFIMSRQEPVSLFNIGLATPISTTVQIIICIFAIVSLGIHKNNENNYMQ